jgi:hypothetical protein
MRCHARTHAQSGPIEGAAGCGGGGGGVKHTLVLLTQRLSGCACVEVASCTCVCGVSHACQVQWRLCSWAVRLEVLLVHMSCVHACVAGATASGVGMHSACSAAACGLRTSKFRGSMWVVESHSAPRVRGLLSSLLPRVSRLCKLSSKTWRCCLLLRFPQQHALHSLPTAMHTDRTPEQRNQQSTHTGMHAHAHATDAPRAQANSSLAGVHTRHHVNQCQRKPWNHARQRGRPSTAAAPKTHQKHPPKAAIRQTQAHHRLSRHMWGRRRA